MAFEKSSICNCCKGSCFPAINLHLADCSKVASCNSDSGNLCSNSCSCFPSRLDYGGKKDCRNVAGCKSVCSNSCSNICTCVTPCYDCGCKDVVMRDEHGGARGNQLHGCFKETSCDPVCQRSPCNYLTSCHDIISYCRRPCGNKANTCLPISNLKASNKCKGASHKPACDHCPHQ